MLERTRITVEGFDGWVGFVCRYRDVNTYRLVVKGEASCGTEARVLDSGKLDRSWFGSCEPAAAVRAIAEYERLCYRAFKTWAVERGYDPAEQPAHAICGFDGGDGIG